MIKKIGIEDIDKGMYVCGMERSGCSPVFLMNDILINSAEDLERIRAKGYASVYISVNDEMPAVSAEAAGQTEADIAEPSEGERDENAFLVCMVTDESAALGAPCEKEEAAPSICAPDGGASACTEFEEELVEAKEIRHEAEQLVRGFLQNARVGKKIESGKVEETVGKMVDSVMRNQDALTSLARLKSFDDYTFAHCVNVCILSLALGRHMGLSKESLYQLGLGAILHDIGKMLIPSHVLNKPGRLTEEEFSLMKRHAELGGEFLSGMGFLSEQSLEVVTQHHERYDGSGYYCGLAGDYIGLFGRIAAVADVYDAMTSNRVYQLGMPREDALKRLYQMRGSFFDPEMVERLIKCLGVYPIGTLVELNTGENAIVKMINHAHPLQPVVLLISDREQVPFPKPVVADLTADGKWITNSKRPDEISFPQAYLTA
ncbi:MAG TPA: hypothetical protein DDW94_07705 [Deltaproteobacteria bacterium]|nr:MAG: hypothetical protein A2Z79_02230 [Deltaproteobacteria bacterium GWA2_55_82]OIJ74232.1 MAG: hypothetical protein A2V21_308130 [Deltaproteobacteria bacterium GWC2_55_46]HBG46859.1 hypothetical protein [Deltaproteobacteria bacterium]HCY11083.1 hypothetical protein [Deltaproteobacteria bacterium]